MAFDYVTIIYEVDTFIYDFIYLCLLTPTCLASSVSMAPYDLHSGERRTNYQKYAYTGGLASYIAFLVHFMTFRLIITTNYIGRLFGVESCFDSLIIYIKSYSNEKNNVFCSSIIIYFVAGIRIYFL